MPKPTKKVAHKNKPHNNTKKKSNKVKTCYSDDKMGQICTTGQYSTYEGNFYKNKDNLKKFAEIKEKFNQNLKFKKLKTHKQKYTKFLQQNFRQGEIPKVIHQIKNDYFSYVNDEWFKANDIEKQEKKYYVQVDNFRIVQEQVYYKLISYVNDFIKENPHSPKAIALKNVYNSLKNDTRKSMAKHVDLAVSRLDKYVEKDDMYGLLAFVNQNETISWASPIHWSITPDEKNVKQYISHISFGKLGIYDYLIYIDDNS